MTRRTTLSLTAVVLLASAPATALDILAQEIVVDVTGDALRVEIDALVDGGGEIPIYALVAPATATLDGAPLELADDTGEYAGLVQWLTVPDGGEQTVRIVIEGAPSCASRVQPGLDACTYRDGERALLPLEPGAAWYLTNLYAADPFVGAVTVRAPDGHFVVAGQDRGIPVVDGPLAGAVRFALAVPTEYLAVVARDVDVVTNGRVSAGVPSEAGRAAMARMVDTAAAVLPHYEAMFGPLPVDDVRFLPLSGRFPFGGMGLLGTILIGDFITLPAFDYIVGQGAAHELAHSWWGGMASAVDAAEGGFLQEAFAEWSAWRAMGAAAGDDAVRDAGVRMNAVWYLTQMADDDDVAILEAAADPDAYVLVTYHKGSVVLRTLEELVGADAFEAALHALVARGPMELSVAALQEELERASPAAVTADVGAVLEQWLTRPGHARLSVTVADGAVHVDDDAGFDVRVPLRITRADGAVRDVVTHAGAGGVTLEDGDVLVEVDPRWTLVRTVTPARPGDVSHDGRVDALDLIEIALRSGGRIPDERRQDGGYDPLYDLDASGAIDADDVEKALGGTP